LTAANQSKTDSLNQIDFRSATPPTPLYNVGNTRMRNYTPVSIEESSVEDPRKERRIERNKRLKHQASPSATSILKNLPKQQIKTQI